jgi:hypothetical protein
LNVPALLGIGRPDRSFRNMINVAVVMLVSFVVGIQWGIVGVSLAWVCAYPLAWLFIEMRTLPVFGVELTVNCRFHTKTIWISSIS